MIEQDPKFPDHERLVIPCDCAGGCTLLVIDRWDTKPGDPDDEFYADLYTRPANWSWRWRLKVALAALAGRPHATDEMVISRPRALELAEWLYEHARPPSLDRQVEHAVALVERVRPRVEALEPNDAIDDDDLRDLVMAGRALDRFVRAAEPGDAHSVAEANKVRAWLSDNDLPTTYTPGRRRP